MEAAGDAGDGEEVEKRKAPSGGEFKTKRKMKTASQLEILEKTYAANMYPPEALRAELLCNWVCLIGSCNVVLPPASQGQETPTS
ncbi:hypothetical protein K2173_014338 [Erythroxylum novogranatense]|uniref:Homeobox domain-containing protein n=1 Tax=Erythroxylum novogranatense TaxID=1862640 RepID=A0AAV8S5R0_9ROSI|nr:hypothetical protein K2173_014338 [Erythroxylum novogranatense]